MSAAAANKPNRLTRSSLALRLCRRSCEPHRGTNPIKVQNELGAYRGCDAMLTIDGAPRSAVLVAPAENFM